MAILCCTFEYNNYQMITVGRWQLSWALRVFESRSPKVMLLLWKTLVLPKIEHCSQLWSPYKAGEIQAFEMLQWSFIRKIKGIYQKDYWQSLKWLSLYSLQRRRERYQIIYVWKILEALVPDLSSDDKNPSISSYNSLRRGRLCNIPDVRTNIPCFPPDKNVWQP